MKTVEYRIEKKISKAGNEYFVLVIKLTDTLEKEVFLTNAELECLRLSNQN